VTLDRPSLNFQQMLLGARSSETVTLINEEDTAFTYEWSAAGPTGSDGSSSSGSTRGVLAAVPDRGTIPPRTSLPVTITFAPAEERAYSTNLVCSVARKSLKLALNAKGEGYAIHDRVTLVQEATTAPGSPGAHSVAGSAANTGAADSSAAASSTDLSPSGTNFVDFGIVQVNERATKRVVIANSGAFSFDFNWTIGMQPVPPRPAQGGSGASGARTLRGANSGSALLATNAAARAVKVTPETGRVPRGGQIVCEVEFQPRTAGSFAGLLLGCTVANSRKYLLSVSACGTKPALEFSTYDVDFGDCFLPPSSAQPALAVTRILQLTNRETERDVSLQCLFPRSPHLDVGCDAAVLRPGTSMDVPLIFYPHEAGPCSFVVPFEVNGLHVVVVNVKGEGVPMVIECADAAALGGTPPDIAFGALRPGQSATRTLVLANRSRRAAVVQVR
jgi:hydrocephalus-inducing protein